MTRNDALNQSAAPVASAEGVPLRFFSRLTWRRTSLFVIAGVALSTGFSASPARASGYLNPRLADPHGHPALANPYAIYFNPAALGGLRGTHVVVDGTLAWRTADFTRRASALSPQAPGTVNDPTYVEANTGDAHASNLVGLPFIAASSDFGLQNFFAGIGAYVPFGGVAKFDQRDSFVGNTSVPGAVDGPQRWALISGVQQALFTTAAAGFRLPEERLSFAVSGSVVLSSIAHYQARNLAGNDDITSEGHALVDVSGVQGSMTAGVYWEPLPEHKLRVGASYAVRPGFGGVRLSGTLRQHSPAYDTNQDVDLLLTYPDVIRAGVAAMPWGSSIELRLDAEYVLWSAFERQCVVIRGQACNIGADGSEIGPGSQVLLAVRRKWKNAGGVRAGLGYFLDDKTEIYGAVGFDTSAVAKANLEPTYPDSFKLMGSLGARREVATGVVIGASYTYVGYLSADTNHQDFFAQAGASRMPNEDGTYGSKLMFFNINAAFAF
ncbi:MAG TPA: outer membrane protein transport protein [Polyangiaceae bacterium]|nr:outer membrane protein transport protein [Polyangiaceae bacterium]